MAGIEWRKLSRGEYKREYGPHSLGEHFTTEEGGHVIAVPRGASTRTRLHELGHAEMGHVGPSETYGEVVERELEADSWAYSKLGRDPSNLEVIKDFGGDIEELSLRGYTASGIFSFLIGMVQEEGYVIDREFKSDLWWYIRRTRDKLKGKGRRTA